MAKAKSPKKEKKAVSEKTKAGFRINYAYFLLAAILVTGFMLRYYHVQYPVIGYHNWKTAHYITEARNFAEDGFFEHGFFVPMRDSMESIYEQPDGAHYDTFPTTPVFIALAFKIFGESLVVARMVNILFSLAAVLALYLLARELFKREDIALITAFLAAINPLFVFFSHNVQLVTPALFFMLLGSYLFLMWLKEKDKTYNLYLGAFFIMFSAVTKYSFAVIGIPLLFIFPFRDILKNWKKYLTPLIIVSLILSFFPIWFVYSNTYVRNNIFMQDNKVSTAESISQLIDFSIVQGKELWLPLESYAADNYTLLGVLMFGLGSFLFYFLGFSGSESTFKKKYFLMLTFGGIVMVIFILGKGLGFFQQALYFSTMLLFVAYLTFLGLIYYFVSGYHNKTSIGTRFILGYFIGLYSFIIIMGFKMSGHSYHQFPIAPLIILMIAYFFDVSAKNIINLAKIKDNLRIIAYVSIIALFLFMPLFAGKNLITLSKESKDRMFDTQFPGLDIAGEYINSHSSPEEKVMHSSGQSFGFLWHADRAGYKPPRDLTYFKEAEEKYGVSWIFMYQWGLERYMQDAELWQYIKDNYRLVQYGFVWAQDPSTGQAVPSTQYLLLKKGGSFDETKIGDVLAGKPLLKRTYYRTSGPYDFMYIDVE